VPLGVVCAEDLAHATDTYQGFESILPKLSRIHADPTDL
jgi:hypothetical protein